MPDYPSVTLIAIYTNTSHLVPNRGPPVLLQFQSHYLLNVIPFTIVGMSP